MSRFKNTSVEVTTFINPHLFWIFVREDLAQRAELEDDLQKNVHPQLLRNAEKGQTVIVYDTKWKRACIKELSNCLYTCWLIDYGVFFDCKKVYKITEEFDSIPTIIKQAALNGVVNVEKKFHVTSIELTHSVYFCPGTIKNAKYQLQGARRVFFECLNEKDGVHIGNIEILTSNGHLYTLANALVDLEMLAFDTELFPEALEKNLELEDGRFLSFTRLNYSPCACIKKKPNNTTLQDIVEDIAESKGIGRGTVRTSRVKEVGITSGKKTLVEDWLKDAESPKDLHYESDESENVTASPNVPAINPIAVSRPDSTPKVTKDCFSKLKQKLLENHRKETKNASPSSTEEAPKPKRISSDFNPLECWKQLELESSKSDISAISSDQNNSSIKEANTSNEIQEVLLQGLENSPVDKKPDEDVSDTASISEKYLAMLEKKFSFNSEASSVKSVPPIKWGDGKPIRKQIDILPAGMTPRNPTKGEASSVKSAPKWSDYSEGKPRQTLINITPAGMSLQQPMKKANSSQSKPLRKGPTLQGKDSNSTQPSHPPSSSSSVTSLPRGNEVARGWANSLENANTAADMLKHHCTRGCTCPQCNTFGEDVDGPEDNEFVDTEPKKRKLITKPTLLLKTEKDKATIVNVISHTPKKTNMTYTELTTAPKIMIHGTTIPSAIASISMVPFNDHIHRALRFFEQLYTIQSFATPCAMRHNNICMVNGPKSGKTMGYLPAVCSFLLEGDRYDHLPTNTISPIVVILCPGSDVANNVRDLLSKLLYSVPIKPTCAFAVPPVDKKCLTQFQRQNDILITTPMVLVSLIRTRIITMKRVCHLIIESGDKILEKFPKEIDSILTLMQSMLEHRSFSATVQMIVTAQHWTFQLENLMKQLNITPVICIGSYLEAALYARADIQMHFLENKNKKRALVELLEDTYTVCKTVVICNHDSEIDEAKEYLNASGVNTVFMYDTMDNQEILEMESKWNITVGGKHLTLLCTDQVYNNHLCVSKAVLLVHYSLPESWSQFANRFSCLMDNYISPLSTEKPTNWVRCKVHVFVDESCTQQFPKLVQFLQRMGAKLSPKFIEYYKKSIKAREETKLASKIKLCQNLKLFGKCASDNRQLYEMSKNSEVAYSSLNCKNRHILSVETDYSTDLPKCGIIQFKIIHVQDVTTFTVKILEHTDPDGTVHKWDSFENLQKELNDAMLVQKITVFDVKIDSWYVWYSENDKTYHRCTIQRIFDVEPITKMATLVRIRLLDSGIKKDVGCSSLYELPKQFRNIPAQGIDIIIANTIPPDLDDSWSSHSKHKVKYILSEGSYQNEEVYGISQILLQLENVIWVKNIHLREKLITIDTIVTKLNLKQSLKDQNLVSYSEEPLERLYDLCKNTGIDLPDFSKLPNVGKELENKSKQQVEPQWAYFEECDCNEIYICCVFAPDLFYVRLKKFYSLFENLQKELQEAIAKPFYPKENEIEVGKHYLVKDFGGDDYCRVKITEIRENIADCYYVDFGDRASVNVADVKHLSDEFIAKLPFQAIECRLYGIQPAWGGDDWEETATNLLSDYIFEPNTDYFRTLYTTTCKEEPAAATGGQKCAILLIDNFKRNKIILINQLLIDCGEAVNIKGEDLDQQFNIPEPCEEEPDDVIDIDDEIKDKDLTIEEIQRLSAKYNTDDNVNNNNVSGDTDANKNNYEADGSGSDDDHSWDIVMNDPEMFMKQLLGKVDQPPTNTVAPELPPMRALEYSNHSTPNIVWFQTEELISFNIMLPDLKDYTLRVIRNKMIMFKTMHDEKEYILELQLYDKVLKTFKYKVYGQYLKVLLNKFTPIEWPRLIFSPERMRHIKYDIDRIDVPEEEKKTFLKFSDDAAEADQDDDCLMIDIGSDEDYSESDVGSIASDEAGF